MNMVKVFIENKEFFTQIKYVFDMFFLNLGIDKQYVRSINNLDSNSINVIYAKNDVNIRDFKNKIFIQENNNIFNSKKYLNININNFKIRFVNFYDEKYKSLYSDIVTITSKNKELYIDSNKLSTNIDIIADAFFMLTRYEEYLYTGITDKHKRFSYRDSLFNNTDIVYRPIVNEYIELFYFFLKKANLNIKRKIWWDNKKFTILLTHDIDSIQKYRKISLKRPLKMLLKEGNIVGMIKDILSAIQSKRNIKKDPFWSFYYINNQEKKYNFKSSYYFMAGGQTCYDNNYCIYEQQVIDLIRFLVANEHEVGIHGSYNSYCDFNLLRDEKKKLDKYSKVLGGRQHYLRFSVKNTFDIHEKIGLLYDATLGYADREGFRAGMCFPFKIFSLNLQRELNLWEIPLNVMDGTLVSSEYSGYNQSEALKRTKKLIDTVEFYNGVFTFLWHNSSLDKLGVWKDWVPVFEEIMNYLGNKHCLSLTGNEIIKKIINNKQ